ncbi:MAG: hypothetical protein J3Q66DRAFT_358883, partial [Benniella sp.]
MPLQSPQVVPPPLDHKKSSSIEDKACKRVSPLSPFSSTGSQGRLTPTRPPCTCLQRSLPLQQRPLLPQIMMEKEFPCSHVSRIVLPCTCTLALQPVQTDPRQCGINKLASGSTFLPLFSSPTKRRTLTLTLLSYHTAGACNTIITCRPSNFKTGIGNLAIQAGQGLSEKTCSLFLRSLPDPSETGVHLHHSPISSYLRCLQKKKKVPLCV